MRTKGSVVTRELTSETVGIVPTPGRAWHLAESAEIHAQRRRAYDGEVAIIASRKSLTEKFVLGHLRNGEVFMPVAVALGSMINGPEVRIWNDEDRRELALKGAMFMREMLAKAPSGLNINDIVYQAPAFKFLVEVTAGLASDVVPADDIPDQEVVGAFMALYHYYQTAFLPGAAPGWFMESLFEGMFPLEVNKV